MTNEEARKAGYRHWSDDTFIVWEHEPRRQLCSCNLIDPRVHFQTRAKMREEHKRLDRLAEAALAKQKDVASRETPPIGTNGTVCITDAVGSVVSIGVIGALRAAAHAAGAGILDEHEEKRLQALLDIPDAEPKDKEPEPAKTKHEADGWTQEEIDKAAFNGNDGGFVPSGEKTCIALHKFKQAGTPEYYRVPYGTYDILGITKDLAHPLACAIEYIYRAGKKPGNNAAQDVHKAINHLERWLADVERK